jgi:adenylate cyclase
VSPPIVVVRETGRTALHLVLTEPLEVGRVCSGLLLDDPQVSRRHLELRPLGEEVQVVDLGSSNGTQIDGEPIRGSATLARGSIVRLGDTTIERGDLEVTDASGDAPSSLRSLADAVAAEPWSELAVDRGTVTIVFTDIEASTTMALRMGDAAWLELLTAHNEVVRDTVRRYGGTEVKAQGDGFMLTFRGARQAVRCMIETQRRLSAMIADAGHDLKVRIGIHTGEAMGTDDLFGRHVIIASRIGDMADGGEILVSSVVREIVASRHDIRFGPGRRVTLKGIDDGDVIVHPVVWEETD